MNEPKYIIRVKAKTPTFVSEYGPTKDELGYSTMRKNTLRGTKEQQKRRITVLKALCPDSTFTIEPL